MGTETETAQIVELTVIQALSRVKTLQARLEQKRESVVACACRDSALNDPVKSEGGSPRFVSSTMDSIRDLERHLIAVRSAVQRESFNNKLTVCGETRTVQEWLNWRREVLPARKEFLRAILARLDSERRRLSMQQITRALEVSIAEDQLREEVAKLVEIEGTLDENLSLHNATVKVSIPA